MVVHQIFTKFAIGLVTGQGKVLAWSRYDAEKQDNLVDTSKLFSSVGWNLVNWNVERTRICLSESTPSYGVDSSFAFSFLRVLPEPNLQGSEESRGSRHSFFTYGPLWTCLVRRFSLSLPLESKWFAVSAEKQEQLYIMNLKTECLWARYFK